MLQLSLSITTHASFACVIMACMARVEFISKSQFPWVYIPNWFLGSLQCSILNSNYFVGWLYQVIFSRVILESSLCWFISECGKLLKYLIFISLIIVWLYSRASLTMGSWDGLQLSKQLVRDLRNWTCSNDWLSLIISDNECTVLHVFQLEICSSTKCQFLQILQSCTNCR